MIYKKILKPASKNSSEFASAMELMKSIPWLSFWSLALFLGGLILIVFFAQIEFLPDLDLKELTSTAVGVALVGMYIVVIIGLGLILPSFFIEIPKDQKTLTKKQSGLIFIEAFTGITCVIALIFGMTVNEKTTIEEKYIVYFAYVTSIHLILFLLFLHFKQIQTAKAIETIKQSLISIPKLALKVLIWGVWSFSIMYLIIIFGKKNDLNLMTLFYLVSCPIIFALISIIIASIQATKNRILALIIIIPMSAIYFTFATSKNVLIITHGAMTILGLSVTNKNVDFVVSENACNAANAVLASTACTWDENKKLGHICNAKLTSRIGSQILISWPVPETAEASNKIEGTGLTCIATKAQSTIKPDEKDTRSWKRLVLNKQDVIAWSYPYQYEKTETTSK